jgi:trehalose 6-phosphate synthase
LWIGWPGICQEAPLDKELHSVGQKVGCSFVPVVLSEEEMNHYYLGFSNETLWPLFHDLQSYCTFDSKRWKPYQQVNRKFAETAAESLREGDFLWVHDYHLFLLAKELHRFGINPQTGFFLHTPFPSADIFGNLPWRREILEAMLEYDLIGFQTLRDKNNFMQCVETFLRGISISGVAGINGVVLREHETEVAVFPISIDFDEFSGGAAASEVADSVKELHQANKGRQIIFGVDRLDYSKGIPLRLRAYRDALRLFPGLRKKVTMIQIVVPSREDIDAYRRLRIEIEGIVDDINDEFTDTDWEPVQYHYHSISRKELLSYYRAASVALITPIKDGMNLVAKEFCAANVDENGVLILSEFTGAAAQLRKHAILVNPHDSEAVAGAIHRAVNMDTLERGHRMRELRHSIRREDIYWWADRFLGQITRSQQNPVESLQYING